MEPYIIRTIPFKRQKAMQIKEANKKRERRFVCSLVFCDLKASRRIGLSDWT